MMQFPSKTNL